MLLLAFKQRASSCSPLASFRVKNWTVGFRFASCLEYRRPTRSPLKMHENASCDSAETLPVPGRDLEPLAPLLRPATRTYKRRFWMLFLFSAQSLLAGLLFPEFVADADVTGCFYGVGAEAVNWSALIAMFSYMVFVAPLTWIVDRTGLRTAVLLGSALNTIGFAVQFATLSRGSYALVLVSAFFGAVATVFILGLPPYLASVWFPSKEASRACAVGVYANTLGIALGFVIPPLLIPDDCSKEDLITGGKRTLATIYTTANAALLILILLTFQNEPDYPPSEAQRSKEGMEKSYLSSLTSLMKNRDFILITIVYGLMFGAYHAVATLLNSIMVHYFPGKDVAIGWMGLLYNVAGLAGTIMAGYALDYTHKFKETAVLICFLSFAACVLFSCLASVDAIWIQFVTIGIFGCFLIGFLPVGFEYAVEVTFPESEVIAAGVLNFAGMLPGIIMTEIASAVLTYSPTYANVVFCTVLLLSGIICSFITKEYKRSGREESPRF